MSVTTELERARRELETRLMWPYTFKSKLMADFQRETLLAARAAFHPTDRYRGTDVLDKLEHLASKP